MDTIQILYSDIVGGGHTRQNRMLALGDRRSSMENAESTLANIVIHFNSMQKKRQQHGCALVPDGEMLQFELDAI